MPAPPPPELTDAQAAVWRDAVSSMPGNWLQRGAYGILIEYTRHVCRARLLEGQVARGMAQERRRSRTLRQASRHGRAGGQGGAGVRASSAADAAGADASQDSRPHGE